MRSSRRPDQVRETVEYPTGVKSRPSRTKRVARSAPSKTRSSPAAPESSTRVTLVESAYQAIRRRILDNVYPQGHQVLEQELAAELGMSRTPIREALVRLEHENLVQLIPRHGMRVVPLSVNDLRDMYEVLTALELTAIERLARARPEGLALAAIDEALDAMDGAIRKRDRDAWIAADERFHRTLLDLSGNARLKTLADVLWDQSHRARITTVRMRPNLQPSNEEHRAVVEAIRRGDWKKARAKHLEHRLRTSGEILDLLAQYGLARV
jgi:DNA-binding GntR family transcriptional regulator